ncbi:NAD(P)/FAD-dependent oxidoreductase [Nocardioides sp. CPCC 206347]|uniref:NAD(P)/FAD-dependent oxidoreductase n=1 Tax=unclassified Nocardioides TaxID=2615069 RepID=UPI00361911C8
MDVDRPGRPYGNVVVVGAGQAGGDLVAHLREAEFEGAITLIGSEHSVPYSRPPLSKAYLLGKKSRSDLLLRSADTYERFGIAVHDAEVESIDRARKRISISGGQHLDYDTLVLATGGRARSYPGGELVKASNVHYLRTLEDADKLRPHLVQGARMTVIGGGYIGLEVAAVASSLGVQTTIVEREQRLLARVTSGVTSSFFARVHGEAGTRVLTGRSVAEFDVSDDRVASLTLDDGTTIETDLCLVGIGLEPDVGLAEACGLTTDDGVVVDHLLRTDDPSIFAIGDVARHPCAEVGGTRRLESIPNCSEQARALAQTLVGNPTPYTAVPWFWSDQFDLKLQVVGLSRPEDEVITRGDPTRDRSISVFYLRDGRVRAAEVVSNPRDFAVAKKMVTERVMVDPQLLGNPSLPLKEIFEAARAQAV